MGFKKIDTNLTFPDIALSNTRNRNMAIQRMKEINAIVDLKPIEEILIRNYPIGKSKGLKETKHILPLSCSNVYFSNNGSPSIPIPSWKPR